MKSLFLAVRLSLTRQLNQFGRGEEGQALVLTALGLLVLLLMAGLGVDVGYLRYQKQQMQKAADAGAIAGASAMIYDGSSSPNITTAAQADAAANGYTNGTNGISVQVNVPPQTPGDPFQGKDNYVEVIVAQTRPTFFMRVGGFDNVYVRSRAIASSVGSSDGCIYALDPVDKKTFLINGNVGISSNCGILVNSSDGDALHKNGVSGTVDASSIGVVGGYSGSGFNPTPVAGIAPFTDPLASVQAPTDYPTTCDSAHTNVVINNNNNLQNLTQGTYCGGITIGGNANVTFGAGTYVLLGGGLTVTGGATITGGGVTFYNTGNSTYPYAPIKVAGSSSTTLTAPSAGPLAGILFFQDRSITDHTLLNTINGSNGAIYTGVLYFPTTPLRYTGTPVNNAYEIIIAWTLEFNGNTTITNHYTTLPNGASPIQSAVLVE
ncbi:MAG TPA: pilus assembly protein TadG-related protein [Terriglobales bacterium]|nr:pilus assembly protein TadG-related protein [Terriglobales bacterium]